MKPSFVQTPPRVIFSWNRTLELIKYTIESYNLHHNKNYKVDTDDEINKYDYLVGYTGILQTIYSILTGIPNGNESGILIAYN